MSAQGGFPYTVEGLKFTPPIPGNVLGDVLRTLSTQLGKLYMLSDSELLYPTNSTPEESGGIVERASNILQPILSAAGVEISRCQVEIRSNSHAVVT